MSSRSLYGQDAEARKKLRLLIIRILNERWRRRRRLRRTTSAPTTMAARTETPTTGLDDAGEAAGTQATPLTQEKTVTLAGQDDGVTQVPATSEEPPAATREADVGGAAAAATTRPPADAGDEAAVSYTHLTLPTILRV